MLLLIGFILIVMTALAYQLVDFFEFISVIESGEMFKQPNKVVQFPIKKKMEKLKRVGPLRKRSHPSEAKDLLALKLNKLFA